MVLPDTQSDFHSPHVPPPRTPQFERRKRPPMGGAPFSYADPYRRSCPAPSSPRDYQNININIHTNNYLDSISIKEVRFRSDVLHGKQKLYLKISLFGVINRIFSNFLNLST